MLFFSLYYSSFPFNSFFFQSSFSSTAIYTLTTHLTDPCIRIMWHAPDIHRDTRTLPQIYTYQYYSLSSHWKEEMKDRQNRYFLCLQNSTELGKDIGLESVFKDTIYLKLKDLGKSQTHTHMQFFVDFSFFF